MSVLLVTPRATRQLAIRRRAFRIQPAARADLTTDWAPPLASRLRQHGMCMLVAPGIRASLVVIVTKGDAQDFLDHLAETVADLRTDLVLDLHRPERFSTLRPPASRRDTRFSTAILVSPRLDDHALLRPPGPHFPGSPFPAPSRADFRPGVLQYVLGHALRWLGQGTGDMFVQTDTTCFRTEPRARDSWLAELLAGQPSLSVTIARHEEKVETRVVNFDISGYLFYQQTRFDAFTPVSEALPMVVDALSELAPHISRGFAVRAPVASPGIDYFVDRRNWPRRPDFIPMSPPSIRVLDEKWIWDAFPVQFLGPRFDLPAAPLDSFDLVPLADGHLLTTRHPDRWFTGDQPPADEVEAARGQLETMLVDRRRFQEMAIEGRQQWTHPG